MKTNVILGTLCVVVTAFALTIGYSQLPGTVVDATELASVYGGACIRDVTGTPPTVCYNMTCASGGCGCTTLTSNYGSGETGGTWDDAKPCGTSGCTAPQTVSGSCAGE